MQFHTINVRGIQSPVVLKLCPNIKREGTNVKHRVAENLKVCGNKIYFLKGKFSEQR